MPQGQFRTRLSPEEINLGVGMLESGLSQRRVAGILNVSQNVIPNVDLSSNPQRSIAQTWQRT